MNVGGVERKDSPLGEAARSTISNPRKREILGYERMRRETSFSFTVGGPPTFSALIQIIGSSGSANCLPSSIVSGALARNK